MFDHLLRCALGRRRPTYARPPRSTRHVWVVTEHGREPEQGFILEWRRHAYQWSAPVVMVRTDEAGQLVSVQRWLAAEHLAPVNTRPVTPDAHTGY